MERGLYMRRQTDGGAGSAPRTAGYNPADENSRLIVNFRDISHTMRSLYEGKGSQKRILMVLLETDGITQRALTERLGIQPGSASEVLAKLENAGLVVRTANPADRRTTDIRLTEKGKRQAREACTQRDRRHAQMFSCLSDAEKAQLLSLLETVNRDWDVRYRGTESAARRREGAPRPAGKE